MSELSAEIETTIDGRIVCEPGYLGYLREHGYTIDEVTEAHAVTSESRDKTHMVANVTTYDLPKDHPELDLVGDELSLWVCSCEDFQYNQSADVWESMVSPSQCGPCKHILEVSKVEKAKNDEQQETL
jgi:hypothetical protein